MGSAPSSQSGPASYFIYLYARSRQSEQPPPKQSKPTTPPPTVTKSIKISQPAPTHPRVASASTDPKATTSTNIKERRAWYRHLKRKAPTKKSALIVRSLIIGPPVADSPRVTKAAARPELAKLKSHLVNPKYANRIIAELRTLPVAGDSKVEVDSSGGSNHRHTTGSSSPIHAVCLEHADAEEEEMYFSKLAKDVTDNMSLGVASFTGMGLASIDKFAELMNEIHVIDLIKSPDLGLGQPGDGPGVLAGAVPTPETVIKGIEQITPQLMALGYAAGRAIVPDHKGVHIFHVQCLANSSHSKVYFRRRIECRFSLVGYYPNFFNAILTYFWRLVGSRGASATTLSQVPRRESRTPCLSLCLMSFQNTQSITGAVMNFLTALSLVNNGVREILPLVRYISQFIDFEFSQIKKQDRGRGVVCAATWLVVFSRVFNQLLIHSFIPG